MRGCAPDPGNKKILSFLKRLHFPDRRGPCGAVAGLRTLEIFPGTGNKKITLEKKDFPESQRTPEVVAGMSKALHLVQTNPGYGEYFKI